MLFSVDLCSVKVMCVSILACRRESCNEGEGDPPLYVNVNMFNGQIMNTWIDSLQAFFPGLLVDTSLSGNGELRSPAYVLRQHCPNKCCMFILTVLLLFVMMMFSLC